MFGLEPVAAAAAKPKRRVRVKRPGAPAPPGDTWCWHCCHAFATQPLPMPIAYDDRRDSFAVMGTFCSWACMKAFNFESKSYLSAVNANIITLFHKKCTGRLGGIRPAPPRITLREFGGRMSIEEFRAASNNPVEYVVLPPRMVEHEVVVTERATAAATRTRQNAARPPPDLAAVVDFKDVSAKNETLRLKRPKPLRAATNLLETAMGLTIKPAAAD